MSGAREVANALLHLLPTAGDTASEEAWVVVAGLAMQGTTFEHDAWLKLVGGLLERQRVEPRDAWDEAAEARQAWDEPDGDPQEAPEDPDVEAALAEVFDQVEPEPEPEPDPEAAREADQAYAERLAAAGVDPEPERVALRDRYTDEERRAAIARAEEIGTGPAARELGIPYPTLWGRRRPLGAGDRPRRRPGPSCRRDGDAMVTPWD